MLIVLEGMDGAGTTTQADLLKIALANQGRNVLVEHEPTQAPIGALIRKLIGAADAHSRALVEDWRTMALLFAADRQSHTHRIIKPALAAGMTVICDRYQLSTLCYQMATAHAHASDLFTTHTLRDWINDLAFFCATPDVTFILEIPTSVALSRLQQRANRDVYENAEFLSRVEQLYAKNLLPSTQRVERIDATQSILGVHKAIADLVETP